MRETRVNLGGNNVSESYQTNLGRIFLKISTFVLMAFLPEFLRKQRGSVCQSWNGKFKPPARLDKLRGVLKHFEAKRICSGVKCILIRLCRQQTGSQG